MYGGCGGAAAQQHDERSAHLRSEARELLELTSHATKAAALARERIARRRRVAEDLVRGAAARADGIALSQQRVSCARGRAPMITNVIAHRREQLAALGGRLERRARLCKLLLQVVQDLAMPLQFVHRRRRAARCVGCLVRHGIIRLAQIGQQPFDLLQEIMCSARDIEAAELHKLAVELGLEASRARR